MGVYGIVLAAGMSTRMGRPKQLLDWHGTPLVCHIAQQARASTLAGLVIVTGAGTTAVRAALAQATPALCGPTAAGWTCQIVTNVHYASGQAGSLRAGLAALPTTADAAVVLLCDQPLVTARLIDTLIAEYRACTADVVAIVPCYQGRRGNPVLLRHTLFATLHEQLSGDEGARSVLPHYANQVYWWDTDDSAVITTVETIEEYQTLREQHDATGTRS
jgi:molybdenum cofactor cytidylyltransferase